MSNKFGVMQHLPVVVCEDANDAIAKGFVYREPKFTPVEIESVVVVRKGTTGGKSTVDLVLQDASGKKFVVMLTGNLIKSIPC